MLLVVADGAETHPVDLGHGPVEAAVGVAEAKVAERAFNVNFNPPVMVILARCRVNNETEGILGRCFAVVVAE